MKLHFLMGNVTVTYSSENKLLNYELDIPSYQILNGVGCEIYKPLVNYGLKRKRIRKKSK
jgi:hypothetical protein